MPSSVELMALQIEALYQCDPDGRLLTVNEPGDQPAPRLFMGRTPVGNLWRFRYDLPAATVTALEQLCLAEPVRADFTSLPQNYVAIKDVLETDTADDEWRGPAFYAPDHVAAPDNVVVISEANAHVLQTWLPDWLPLEAVRQPYVALIQEGAAVAVCFSARLTAHAAEAGVETHEAFRGRGYASAVVAGWIAAVRASGRIPLYSTSWDNLASQGVARRLGLELYGEDWSIE